MVHLNSGSYCVLLQCCFIIAFGNKYNQPGSWQLMNMDWGCYISIRSILGFGVWKCIFHQHGNEVFFQKGGGGN